MSDTHQEIRQLIGRVRARWRALSIFQATVRAALASAAVLVAALVAASWIASAPLALAVGGACALAFAIAAVLWGLAPLRDVPSDARVARFIEERAPALDDRLVTAIDRAAGARRTSPPEFAEPMLARPGAQAKEIDRGSIV